MKNPMKNKRIQWILPIMIFSMGVPTQQIPTSSIINKIIMSSRSPAQAAPSGRQSALGQRTDGQANAAGTTVNSFGSDPAATTPGAPVPGRTATAMPVSTAAANPAAAKENLTIAKDTPPAKEQAANKPAGSKTVKHKFNVNGKEAEFKVTDKTELGGKNVQLELISQTDGKDCSSCSEVSFAVINTAIEGGNLSEFISKNKQAIEKYLAERTKPIMAEKVTVAAKQEEAKTEEKKELSEEYKRLLCQSKGMTESRFESCIKKSLTKLAQDTTEEGKEALKALMLEVQGYMDKQFKRKDAQYFISLAQSFRSVEGDVAEMAKAYAQAAGVKHSVSMFKEYSQQYLEPMLNYVDMLSFSNPDAARTLQATVRQYAQNLAGQFGISIGLGKQPLLARLENLSGEESGLSQAALKTVQNDMNKTVGSLQRGLGMNDPQYMLQALQAQMPAELRNQLNNGAAGVNNSITDPNNRRQSGLNAQGQQVQNGTQVGQTTVNTNPFAHTQTVQNGSNFGFANNTFVNQGNGVFGQNGNQGIFGMNQNRGNGMFGGNVGAAPFYQNGQPQYNGQAPFQMAGGFGNQGFNNGFNGGMQQNRFLGGNTTSMMFR